MDFSADKPFWIIMAAVAIGFGLSYLVLNGRSRLKAMLALSVALMLTGVFYGIRNTPKDTAANVTPTISRPDHDPFDFPPHAPIQMK